MARAARRSAGRLRVRCAATAAVLLSLATGGLPGGAHPSFIRYRVEQVFRLETTTAEARPLPGRLRAEPVTTAMEGRVRLVLEQRGEEKPAGRASQSGARVTWRFTQVEVEGPSAEPAGATNPEVERALVLGLAWMRQLEGKEFTGLVSDLPVLPLGEAPPGWLTAWLRWAQTGGFAGVDSSPVELPASSEPGAAATTYQVQWLRSDFRQELCHVQQARWVVPVQAAPASVSPELAAEGVEARTHFAATSLEWVSQDNPELVYAERSAVRETYWNLEKVRKPELRELVFRLRFAVQVRVERLP